MVRPRDLAPRPAHMLAALDSGKYDWVLYADIDWVVQDMMIPIESFVNEWEHHGKMNVHVFVPDDGNTLHTFSAFAVLIRNSSFGRLLLENWMKFAKGLCPSGNLRDSVPGKYTWTESDQPGLWYSLAQTHSDFYSKGTDHEFHAICNKTTGYIETGRYMGPELRQYMIAAGVLKHADMSKILDDQPIIWSRTVDGGRSGLGVQQTFGRGEVNPHNNAFALHKKRDLPRGVRNDVQVCKERHGCHANYTAKGQLEILCDH